MMQLAEYKRFIESLPFGKMLPTAVYFHSDYINEIPPELAKLIVLCRERFNIGDKCNVIKCFRLELKISFLSYPGFFDEPHPALHEAISIDLATGKHRFHDYGLSQNSPILHRKEELLPSHHPKRPEFARLTLLEEKFGLLDDKSRIGFRVGWERTLKEKGFCFRGTDLIKSGNPPKPTSLSSKVSVRRHRTAIARTNLSKPVQSLLDYGLLESGVSFFDYGCGQGDDIRLLSEFGIHARGWDPIFRPTEQKGSADIVNLGFVLNVIEDPLERIQTLREAYSLTERLLVVSVISIPKDRILGQPFGDGFLTARGTFQKYFSQSEIRQFIEDVLDTTAIAAGLGVFFIFKNPADHQGFIQRRVRREIDWKSVCGKVARPPRAARIQLKFLENRDLLESFWNRMLNLGRIPRQDEFDRFDELREKIGSGSRARGIFIALYGEETIESARRVKTSDWLVFLALVNFRRRVAFSHFSGQQQTDIRAFFGSFSEALNAGQELLYQIADIERITQKCDSAGIGWCDEQALYIHRDLVNSLDPLLRVYVGCGEILFGDLRQADIIKIHKRSSKLTILKYDEFEQKPLPELETRTKINLRTQEIDIFDHRNPGRTQLLYFKERFVAADNPNRKKWESYSRKLKKIGLDQNAGLGPTKEEFLELLSSLHLTCSLTLRKAEILNSGS